MNMKTVFRAFLTFSVALFSGAVMSEGVASSKIVRGEVVVNEDRSDGGKVLASFKIEIPLNKVGTYFARASTEGYQVVGAELKGLTLKGRSVTNAKVKVLGTGNRSSVYKVVFTVNNQEVLVIDELVEEDHLFLSSDNFDISGASYRPDNKWVDTFGAYVEIEDVE